MKTYLPLLAALCLLCLACENGRQDKSNTDFTSGLDWFTDRGNLAHTAAVNDSLTLPLAVRWQADLPGTLYGGVTASAVGSYGKVFVGVDSAVFCLNPEDGAVNWSFQSDGIIFDAATAVQLEKEGQKRVFFNTSAGTLYALDGANANVIWTQEHFPTNFTSATNYAKGRLYFSHMDNQNFVQLKSVTGADGTEEWRDTFINSKVLTPIHGMGSIFFGGKSLAVFPQVSFYFRFDDFSGEREWDYPSATLGSVSGPSAFHFSAGVLHTDVDSAAFPLVIFATGFEPARVHAVRANNGQQLWETDLSLNSRVTGFALTQGRTPNYLIVSTEKAIYRLGLSDGSILWQMEFGTNTAWFNRATKPAIWGGYVFQVMDSNRRLAALNLEMGTEAWSYQLDTTAFASPMIGGNTLYLGTTSGKFYAFSPE